VASDPVELTRTPTRADPAIVVAAGSGAVSKPAACPGSTDRFLATPGGAVP
jgi:hypothetical protein